MAQDVSLSNEFARLFQQYAAELYRLAAAIVWDTHEAEDIVQESFLRLHESMRKKKLHSGNGSVLTFLKTTARNLAIDRIRRRQVRADYLHNVAKIMPEHERSPFQLSQDREWERSFYQALGTLPDLQRTALVLRVIEGASYEEISKVLGVDTKNVKTHISRARAKLRPILADREE